ncbi:TonB-dependent vitamin B12 receptor [Pseudomonas aeruginosa]|uniref:TonB-dependent vitamin B12 receptor n=1 Tax=Pseudomonas paraeruginosa (strain DSM 24068 / PA7) TaxID=381754 RepID=A6V8T8_PSEP7|nr:MULTISPECIES: TonB-dependent vitamin B12 receptor [Pseudomonas aeruginosa group]ABR85062.1 TonB-dependent vitamin B12 receptor [Pseudomonas aeruginosa PA7]KSC52850.1 TonB-dependent vitamin B12 receptor [Pseudomonas paraeruginosa]KSC94560.1 TonB-dependent vitamin B12 receptor [Pseudomonas aeruginosa]KSD28863.1 TonB-dependent vitamin B12 receptor [Pseudomonas aeruginosa]KSG49914.1 TonB-dependent vitamin B12 receptor [Pseudomonas aeruginosa]
MNRVFLTPAAVALCGASSLSLAEPVSLDDQVVTATRTARTAAQSLAAVSVIDRAEIERSQARSVPELLRQVPGVSLANNGGFGKNTTLFLRGTESDHVLVLIDGIKVGSASAGLTAFQDLPVELIERIEVVRGPRSSLYGSEAIGGVIQIFTRRGDGQGAKPFFSAGYGTHHTLEGSAGVSGGAGNGWYSLGVSSFDTAGINTKRAGTGGDEPDRDGYRNLSGNLRGGYRFDNGLELDGTLLRAKSHNDYDQVFGNSGFNANADGEQNLVGGRARFTPLDPWLVTLQAGRSEDKADAYQDGRFYSRFDTRRDSLSWQNDLTLAEGHVLTLGYDWQKDEIGSSEAFSVDSRLNKGWFAQYLGQHGRQDWQLSLRRDDNQQFGVHDTGSAAWGYALSDALRFTVSYGTAFKAPTFNELYYPDYGNPDLDAETSRSLEVGLSGTHAWGHWAVNAYRTDVDDLIGNDPRPAPGRPWGQPNNIDQARIRGVELVLGSQWLGWDWNANATFLDPQNRSGGVNHGNELPRRARRMFNLELDRRFERLSLGASVHAEGRRYDDPTNKVRLGGYATLDLRSEYRLNDEWRLQGRIANLFGADYETAYGYNQPGQAVYLSVRYQAL